MMNQPTADRFRRIASKPQTRPKTAPTMSQIARSTARG
jgi:hypothetical protein